MRHQLTTAQELGMEEELTDKEDDQKQMISGMNNTNFRDLTQIKFYLSHTHS
jgi:hypothetical protein